MLVTARLIDRLIQPGILTPKGKAIARNVVCGTIINDPRDDGLQVLGGLVKTSEAVDERRRVGKGGVGDVGGVVGGNGGPDVEENAVVIKDAWRTSHGPVACSE